MALPIDGNGLVCPIGQMLVRFYLNLGLSGGTKETRKIRNCFSAACNNGIPVNTGQLAPLFEGAAVYR
jgi:hypothetical protein